MKQTSEFLWGQHIQPTEKQPQELAHVPAVLFQSCTQKITGQKRSSEKAIPAI